MDKLRAALPIVVLAALVGLLVGLRAYVAVEVCAVAPCAPGAVELSRRMLRDGSLGRAPIAESVEGLRIVPRYPVAYDPLYNQKRPARAVGGAADR